MVHELLIYALLNSATRSYFYLETSYDMGVPISVVIERPQKHGLTLLKHVNPDMRLVLNYMTKYRMTNS